MRRVAIIGGGFSGLTVAWALWRQKITQCPDLQIDIYEAQPQWGGLLKTKTTEQGLVEAAANAILSTPDIQAMAKDFGITWAHKKKTAKKRWVMHAKTQKPSRWPLSFWQTCKNLDRLLAVARGSSRFAPKEKETVKQWGLRVFRSPEVIDDFISPALSGIYSSPAEELSASLCFKSLFTASSTKSLGSQAPEQGMGEFFTKGYEFFKKQEGVSFYFNTPVQDVNSVMADAIVDCRPNALGLKLHHNYICSVSMFWKISDRPYFEGFGCLFPQSQKFLGVLFDSDIFAGRTQDPDVFLEKWIIRTPEPITEWTEEMTKELIEFRQKTLHHNHLPSPLSVHAFCRPEQTLPRYDLQLESQLQAAHKKYHEGTEIYIHPKNPKHIFHGNYLGEIGLNKIFYKSLSIARYVCQGLAETDSADLQSENKL